jgi:hypothetical protein
MLVHLGRLQYRRARAGWSAAGAPFAAGDPVLDLHIPPTGPLAPGAVDASLAEARATFGRVFPADDSPWGVCSSWLLDPTLAEVLPEDSNIVRFQRRFRLDPDWAVPADDAIVEFVFRRVHTPVEDLPPATTALERAIVGRLAAGGHWQTRWGWCEAGPDRLPALAASQRAARATAAPVGAASSAGPGGTRPPSGPGPPAGRSAAPSPAPRGPA